MVSEARNCFRGGDCSTSSASQPSHGSGGDAPAGPRRFSRAGESTSSSRGSIFRPSAAHAAIVLLLAVYAAGHKLPEGGTADMALDDEMTYESYSNESQTALMTQTAGKCKYIEGAFEETFASDTLNLTRWKESSVHGLFHCGKGSKRYCTMALAQNFMLNQTLPFYPGGGSGAILTLSQNPCTNKSAANYSLCCRRDHCANWTGAHATSNGCILYGTLGAEMSIHIPVRRISLFTQDDNPALFDWGTFINGGSPDPTWNEIDQIFRIGPNGSEYHATYFTPGEHKTVFNPYSDPPFNGYIESSYHNYTLYWTPDYLAWTIDKETYRNITYRSTTNRPPWRPMSYRLIFRTENSSYPGPAQDAHIYIKRIWYEPMPPPKPLNFVQEAEKYLYGPYYIIRVIVWAACWISGCIYLRGGTYVLFS